MVNPYPILVGPSPKVKGTFRKLRRNCWHKSLELNIIISMFMAGKSCCGQTIDLWKLSLRSHYEQPLNACNSSFCDCSKMLSRSATSLVLKCFWQTLCHVPIYQQLPALQLKKRRKESVQLITCLFQSSSWLKSSVKLQQTQCYSPSFK